MLLVYCILRIIQHATEFSVIILCDQNIVLARAPTMVLFMPTCASQSISKLQHLDVAQCPLLVSRKLGA